ncbi:MAG: class I SAM-dependent methyltransferase [Tissierellia bacterium]|nr:class I SAM-dependent methyltransferase [Tissierellia bacterium]
MIKKYFDNTRKPKDSIAGRMMLKGMNKGHAPNFNWGVQFLPIPEDGKILDIGCGGGKNISEILKLTKGKVMGIDYSIASVKMSQKVNRKAIEEGRCEIIQGDVSDLPFKEEFNLITAFETIYFWPDIVNSFRQVYQALQKDGVFFICNEDGETKEVEKWKKLIDMNTYTRKEIRNIMEEAGFVEIEDYIHENKKRMVVLGKKK